MANQELKLNKAVFGKVSYPQIVDTEFKQLVQPNEVTPDLEPLTVTQFFEEYNRLFFDIPQSGEVGSHTELVTRSSSYVGITNQSPEMQALIDEISDLQNKIFLALNINQQGRFAMVIELILVVKYEVRGFARIKNQYHTIFRCDSTVL